MPCRCRQNHWSERGRATSVANADTLGRPRRSVLSLGRITHRTTKHNQRKQVTMSDNNEKKQLTVSAGVIALALAGIGWLFRIVVMGSNGPRLEEAGGYGQMGLGSIAAILLFVAGLLGLYGAVKNDGRGAAIGAIVLSGIFIVTLFAAVSR